MTTDMMNFRDLVEKAADADLLREMIGFAAERLMEMEVGAATAASLGPKDLHLTVKRCKGALEDMLVAAPRMNSSLPAPSS